MKQGYSLRFGLILCILFFGWQSKAQYCTPTYINPCSPLPLFADYIDNFSTTGGLTNITNNATGCSPSNYTYYNGMNVSQVQGQSFNVSMQCASSFAQGFRIWIDYNNDNDFADLGEDVYNSGISGTGVFTGSITVPLTATPGIKRMRVMCRFATVPLTTDHCSTGMSYGECEDYNMTVIALTPCTGTPTAGTAVASASNPCPGVPVSFNLVGASLTSGLIYTWLQSTTGAAPWVPVPPPIGTLPTLNISPPAGGFFCYRCIVACAATGLFDTSAMACTQVQPWSCNTACYGISAATSNADQEILNVNVANINNTTDCTNPLAGSQGTGVGTASMYANFDPGVAPGVVYLGLSTPFSLTIGTCGFSASTAAKIYIDFNHNASFLDPGEEVYSNPSIPSVSPSAVLTGSFTAPLTALTGCTKMRVITKSSAGGITPVGTYGTGETEDYSLTLIQPSPYDPAITNIVVPTGTCFSSNETITATLCNYGSSNINLGTNNVTVSLNVNGPGGVNSYTVTASSGILLPYGGSCVTLTFPNVNMFPGGSYAVNSTLTLSGLVNGNLINDSITSAIQRANYRPTGGPDYHVCEGSVIPFGQGLTVSGCATPINDSLTINFTLASSTPVPCLPSSTTYTGACLLASGNWPTLPPGTTFTSGILKATNLATANGGWANETRMPLFKGSIPITSSTILFPSAVGNPATGSTNYTWQNSLTGTQLGSIYGATGALSLPLNVGYHSTWIGNATSNGFTLNAGSPTVVTLKVYYTWVPASFEWYNVPAGGTVLYNYSPFNPVGVTGSGVLNTNTPGTTPFYASCTGSSDCRVQVNLVVDSIPSVSQDTLLACEYAVGSNSAAFDLTTISGAVSNYDPATTVTYAGDQALFLPILNPTNDTSSTNFIYSIVSYANGCYSSDSVLLDVKPIPQFTLPVYTGNACAPFAMDISSLINVFPASGNDTLYFQDPAYTIPFLNPHAITLADTLYMIVKSNSGLPCADSSLALIDIIPATNYIANQDTILNFSNCGSVGCGNINMGDGATETLFTTSDCRRIATITDKPNLISMGTTQICEDIDCGIQTHNGQPYVIRHYEITPSTNDSAQVCLYYVQQDFNDFNDYAVINGWDQLNPSTNLCITQVDGGILGAPGTTALSIPNSSITSSFDALTSVWTVCFPVDSFSAFYCHTCNPANAALPVELLSFIGKREGSTSSLKWITSSEQNNHHFVVERSKDAKSFTRVSDNIASKGLNGNSHVELNYSFIDMSPMNGHNYYRLQQVDIDGNISESSTVDVYFGEETLVSLYPNPASKTLNIDINTPKSTNAKVKIMDAAGRVVRTIDIPLQAGNNTSQVEVSSLADGMYMIQITNEKGLNYTQTFRKN